MGRNSYKRKECEELSPLLSWLDEDELWKLAHEASIPIRMEIHNEFKLVLWEGAWRGDDDEWYSMSYRQSILAALHNTIEDWAIHYNCYRDGRIILNPPRYVVVPGEGTKLLDDCKAKDQAIPTKRLSAPLCGMTESDLWNLVNELGIKITIERPFFQENKITFDPPVGEYKLENYYTSAENPLYDGLKFWAEEAKRYHNGCIILDTA